MSAEGAMGQILEMARWAPSGDNTQPWRFEVLDEHHAVVHGFDTRDHCVYDLNGHPSQISLGALLETMKIAASAHGLAMSASRRESLPETTPTFDVRFMAVSGLPADPLISSITKRSVQRRPMSSRALTAAEKQALEGSVGPEYTIQWFESFQDRFRTACLMFNNAKLRLTMPEAYLVHRSVIQWGARYSEDRVPDQALGIDPLTARLMQWVMKSWNRVVFFNTFLAGTWAPRIQMDFIPSLACGAHFVLMARGVPTSVDDFVGAGRAVQRFWLTATHLGLVQQPEMTPLIFASYVREDTCFTSSPNLLVDAAKLAVATRVLLGAGHECAVWMGRVGAGPASASRSVRRPLSQLMIHGEPPHGLESSR